MLLGVLGNAARAQTLYGVTYNPARLITIDTTTGAGTLVAPLTGFTFSAPGLAFRGPNLYVMDAGARRIKEIDQATGATLNTIDIGIASFGEGDMAFRSDGMGFICSFDLTPLYRFDITVPNSTAIGPLNPNITMDALAFNAADVLYGISQSAGLGADTSTQLYTIDQTTGVLTLIGPTGLTGTGVGGMAFDSAGNLFAALGFFGNPTDFYSINTTTGAATLIGPIGFTDVTGIAFTTGPPPPPPTAGVTIAQSGGSTNVTEGGATDGYTVVLNTAPTANVTITINPGTQVTVAPTTLTFTPANWNVAQTVTVTAFDDALVEGAHVGTITHTSASADLVYNVVVVASVTANITDNDVGPLPPPPPTPGGGIAEGNYPGSLGLGNGPGGEGTFGFGRHFRQPMFKGPHRDPLGRIQVFNVAHRQPQPTVEADTGLGIVGWGLLSLAVLAPAALVFGRRRPG